MATTNGTAKPAMQETGILDSVLGDIMTGGRGAPRPNPEVVARAKRRTYTADYKLKVLGEADAASDGGSRWTAITVEGVHRVGVCPAVEEAQVRRETSGATPGVW